MRETGGKNAKERTGYWVIRTYRSGRVGEKIKYFVPGERPTRSERKLRADLRKLKQNEESAERQAARLLNENFGEGDIFLGLDYGEAAREEIWERAEALRKERKAEREREQPPEGGKEGATGSEEAGRKRRGEAGGEEAGRKRNAEAGGKEVGRKRNAEAGGEEALTDEAPEDLAEEYAICEWLAAAECLTRLIRRVRREAARRGLDFKYLAVTSDLDAKTGERVRVHHHLVINRECLDLCREKWEGLGRVSWSRLWEQPDLTPIAAYMIRQVRYIRDAKRFVGSRNLKRPEPKDRMAKSGAEMRPPKGCFVVQRGEYRPGWPQYIRYVVDKGERGQAACTGDKSIWETGDWKTKKQ